MIINENNYMYLEQWKLFIKKSDYTHISGHAITYNYLWLIFAERSILDVRHGSEYATDCRTLLVKASVPHGNGKIADMMW